MPPGTYADNTPDQSHLGCRGDFDRSVQTYEY